MIRTEIGAHHLPALGGKYDKSSAARQAALERSLQTMSVASGKSKELLDVETVKIALLTSPVSNETTMVCFVSESSSEDPINIGGVLHVQFYQEGNSFHTYGTASLDEV